MFIYTQSTTCTAITDAECDTATGLQKGETCVSNGEDATPKCKIQTECSQKTKANCGDAKVPDKKKCVADGEKCKIIDESTNSSNMLNIFKITFALLVIFTIL